MTAKQLAEGDKARVAQPVIEGSVAQVKYDENTGEKRLLLRWKAKDGTHERWFGEADLEPAEAKAKSK